MVNALRTALEDMGAGLTGPRPKEWLGVEATVAELVRKIRDEHRDGATSHAHAAVDRQPGAGDESGRVRGEEHHRVRHVRDLAEPTQWRQADDIADDRVGTGPEAKGDHVL